MLGAPGEVGAADPESGSPGASWIGGVTCCSSSATVPGPVGAEEEPGEDEVAASEGEAEDEGGDVG